MLEWLEGNDFTPSVAAWSNPLLSHLQLLSLLLLHQVLDSRDAGVPAPFWSIATTYFLSPARFGRPHRRVPLNPARACGSVCGVGLCQNCRPVCRTILRRRLSPKHPSNQGTTHRQLFLRSDARTLLVLVVRSVLRLILLISSSRVQALTLSTSMC